MKLLILGAGAQGHICHEIAQAMGVFDYIAFLDDRREGAIGKLNDYMKFKDEYSVCFVAIGDPHVRELWMKKMEEAGFTLATLIDPTARISKYAKIGRGSVVMRGSLVQGYSKIGKGCILSAGSIVDHDTTLGNYVQVNCGAIVSARKTVPDGYLVDYGVVYR